VVATNRALSSYEGVILPDGFKSAAYLAVCDREEGFTYDEQSYTLDELGGEISILDASGATYAVFSQYSIARYTGEDTLAYARRLEIRQAIEAMNAAGETSWDFRMLIEQRDPDTSSVLQDENGNDIYAESDAKIERKNDRYEITTDSYTTLIDRYAKPGKGGSGFHLLGTDADGYDVLARIMYGGRVSLLVGFIVVIIESVLGIIMGGIAGYFGGWVDTVIMRLVDVFYCIPSMPILIILGALFDTLQMTPYVRLAWMMAVLGFLGWAGVARLVRGQILSLREQEFMVATEATGLRVNRRIFRHLVPNVMPQLIVTATAGLGGVILTESTLSFLGLGVKRPLSTWGAMINSVSSYTAMINYTYIWVPVGLLICLTVIAFNFVGDGLRDAFDPKMKR
jgi:peptide/nickel transport system permease protein